MAKEDWYEAGERIRSLVQDAVDRQDFSELSSTIGDVINQAADGVADAVNQAAGGVADAIHDSVRGFYSGKNTKYVDGKWEEVPEEGQPDQNTAGRGPAGDYRGFGRSHDYHASADRIRRQMQQKQEEREKTALIPRRSSDLVAGNAMKWVGFGLGGAAGCAFGVLASIAAIANAPVVVPGVLLLGVTGAGVGLGFAGIRKTRLVKRFRQYLDVMGGRAYVTLQELADGTGRTVEKVRKDLKKMVRQGFFPQAYLDQKETTLMLDSKTYQQYLATQEAYEQRAASAENSSAGVEGTSSGSDAKLDPEVRELIREGKRYIRHVHECNDKIPGEEMSAKLDRLDPVVTRIVEEVEHRPQLAGDLRRMMNYYLPTTEKLLDAYCELDAQPVHGANMDKTKQEIEASLDTINDAFENLLDSFFEHQAWDISADISVLNNMFAQEGLTGNKDFNQTEK